MDIIKIQIAKSKTIGGSMKEFARIIRFVFLFISCALVPLGCGNGEKYVQGGAAAPAVDCYACHATAQPSDPPAVIQADIIDTHFDLDTIGKCSVTTEETCSSDADCPSGETCDFFPLDGYLLDTCGSCSITTATSCGADSDCPSGETCVDGQVPSWALGTCSTTTTQLCRIDAGCPTGETCITPTSYVRLYNSCESDVAQRTRVSSSTSCAASCHVGMSKDLKINLQWKHSPHGNSESEPFIHNFPASFSGGVCLRCHSGIGYAMYVEGSAYPSYTAPSTEQFPHQITCNGCHIGTQYASPENRRLRRSGDVTFISGGGAGSIEGTINAGNSATCIACHQGRESGLTVFKALVGLGVDPYNGVDEPASRGFINSHYRAAGATLFSKKGYEYQGKTYYNGNPFHQTMLCTGCHMAESDDEELGGHSFEVRIDSGGINIKENISVCQKCHGTVTSFETIGALRDMDGDGALGSVKNEIEGLKTLITQELAAGKTCGALVNNQIFYNPAGYPYFFTDTTYTTGVQNWCESQLAAAFNLHFINTEPGVYAHNFRYAVQLLRDSYEDLTGAPLNGVRPSSGGDRPATIYTP